MKRLAFVALAVMLLAGCQDGTQPDETGQPSFSHGPPENPGRPENPGLVNNRQYLPIDVVIAWYEHLAFGWRVN